MRNLLSFGLALMLSAASVTLAQAPPDQAEATTTSALFLLKRAVSVQRDGRHNLLLRALRQLRDPALAPLYQHLLETDNPALRIHGLLGSAECAADGKLDLERLAAVSDPRLQAEMISAAMDSQLLSDEQAVQAAAWTGLDSTVRLLVAVQLAAHGQFRDTALVEEALGSDHVGRRALAGLLLMQMGQAAGLETLRAVDQSSDPRRDQVREMVLSLALRFELASITPWASALAADPSSHPRLTLNALQAALRFTAPGSVDLWRTRFDASDDLAQRTRLALVLLHAAPWQKPAAFEHLLQTHEPLLKQIGATGSAVAAGGGYAAAAVAQLVALQHPLSTDWALKFARDHAAPADVPAIWSAVVSAYAGSPRNQAQRFEDVVAITQVLFERQPAAAAELIAAQIISPDADDRLQQALLLGLLRCTRDDPTAIVEGLPPAKAHDVNALALLLLARHDRPMSDRQIADLGLVVRGGGDLPDALRLQAAWLYLKRTGQTDAGLAALTGP